MAVNESEFVTVVLPREEAQALSDLVGGCDRYLMEHIFDVLVHRNDEGYSDETLNQDCSRAVRGYGKLCRALDGAFTKTGGR